MAVTEGKKKKPPTFHYLPKSRARRLKKSWVEDHKIRSKWKAQKKREGLTNQTGAPVEGTSDRAFQSDAPSNRQGKDKSAPPTPPNDEHLLCDLGKIAKPISTRRTGSPRPQRAPQHSYSDRSGKNAVRREARQPNMKLRMNVLLERIKRDSS